MRLTVNDLPRMHQKEPVLQNLGVGCGERKCKVLLCYTASEVPSGVATHSMVRARLGERMHDKHSLEQSQFQILRVYAGSTSGAKSCWYFLWIGERPRFAAYTAIHPIFAEVKSCSPELSVVLRHGARSCVRPCTQGEGK